MWKHVRKHDNESEEGETMEDHDAALYEWEIPEENRIGQDDKEQDGEGDHRDLPIARPEGPSAQVGESNDLLAGCLRRE
jgi:hypothetical protein